jgi:N-dimethylarginine dimethylaminohydrolase
MKFTCHSEYHKLASVIIKPVANAFVSEELLKAQWEPLHFLDKPDFQDAVKEFAEFQSLLKSREIHILQLPKKEGLSIDSIYCRDASIATDFGMIICNMGKPQRSPEPEAQKAFFLDNDLPILGRIQHPGTLEGGDVAWLDQNTLAVGHTYRTNKEGITQLKGLLEPKGIQIIVVDLPHYKGPSDVFHLMSICSPVGEKLAVVYSPLMPISFRNELIERGFDLVEVPDSEFETMGCNVLAIGSKTCIMLKGNPVTEKRLLDKGCTVFTYQGEHISVMGGGGPTCLTRPLQRGY